MAASKVGTHVLASGHRRHGTREGGRQVGEDRREHAEGAQKQILRAERVAWKARMPPRGPVTLDTSFNALLVHPFLLLPETDHWARWTSLALLTSR